MDEIRYRYAETFANTGEHAQAVPEFQKLIQDFPKSDWACWAYFRQGESFDKLGKNGKPFYQGATEGACAKSAAAKEARAKKERRFMKEIGWMDARGEVARSRLRVSMDMVGA